MTGELWPRAPGQITIGWVESALRRAEGDPRGIGADASIGRVAVEAIADLGGVNGETYRVVIEYARGDGPRALVAKFPADRPGPRATAAFQHWYEREVEFYRTLAAACPLRTPRCYDAAIDPEGGYVLLLEDLRPRTQGDQVAGCSVEQARTAIEAAAALHTRWWGAPPPVSDSMPETTIGLERAGRVQGALARVWARLGDRLALPDSVAAGMPRLVEGYVALLRTMASAPVTVIHGDYRLDNLFFEEAAAPGGPLKVTAIDWQFVCRCRGMYDVGYFIGLDLDPQVRRAHERDLVAAYVEALRRDGVQGYGDADAWEDYRRALLLGFAVFLIGAAGEQPNERMALVHEVGLARIAAAIEDTGALDVLAARGG
ncbi:MAG: phosphotransferase [Dehalococcoidia bacterium]